MQAQGPICIYHIIGIKGFIIHYLDQILTKCIPIQSLGWCQACISLVPKLEQLDALLVLYMTYMTLADRSVSADWSVTQIKNPSPQIDRGIQNNQFRVKFYIFSDFPIIFYEFLKLDSLNFEFWCSYTCQNCTGH